MAFHPDFEVRVWPVDNTSGAGTVIDILSGSIKRDQNNVAREFQFELPVDFDDVLDNYEAFSTLLLQTGAYVRVKTTEDDFSTNKVEFYGTIWEIDDPVERGEQVRVYTCRCLGANQRSTNVNFSRATNVLIYEVEFDSADFNADDINFLVDLPDNSEDWMPGGVIYLAAYFVDDTSDNERHVHDYGQDEYTYAAANKQLYFHQSGGGIGSAPATEKKTETSIANPNGWTWVIHLLYYDQTDTENSVNQVITDIATGEPWGDRGGLGWASGNIDLATIVSFDAVSTKLIRTVNFEKIDGPISQIFDEMRDAGLIPLNYWLRHDPTGADPPGGNIGKFKGEYLEQNNAAVVTPSNGVLRYRMPATQEAVAGRVENWSEAITPRNLALDATVTTNVPSGYSTIGSADNLKDAIHETFFQIFKDMTSGPNYPLTPTPQDCIVFKLKPSDEEIPEFRRLHIRHTHTQEDDGGTFIDIPVYQVSRMPRLTVSASEYRIAAEFSTTVDVVTSTTIFTVVDVSGFEEGDRIVVALPGGDFATIITDITASQLTVSPACTGVANGQDVTINNPGIPVSPDSINVMLDPQNISDDGRDIDAATEFIHRAKYVAIRWEQDFFYRRDGNSVGSTARQSWYGLSEVKILTDERFRYRDGVDQGQIPYAQITDRGTEVDVVTDTTHFTVLSITDTEGGTWMVIGDTIQIDRAGTIEEREVTNIVGLNITIGSAVVGITSGDDVGWRKRWMEDFAGSMNDLYFPKLYQKTRNTTDWLDIIQDDNSGFIEEAEMAALEKLLENIQVIHDHRCMVPVDHSLEIGVTMKVYSDTVPFLITSIETILNPEPEEAGEDNPPKVVYDITGTNFEESPQ